MIIKVYKCLLVVEDDIKKKYAVNIDSNLYVNIEGSGIKGLGIWDIVIFKYSLI